MRLLLRLLRLLFLVILSLFVVKWYFAWYISTQVDEPRGDTKGGSEPFYSQDEATLTAPEADAIMRKVKYGMSEADVLRAVPEATKSSTGWTADSVPPGGSLSLYEFDIDTRSEGPSAMDKIVYFVFFDSSDRAVRLRRIRITNLAARADPPQVIELRQGES